MEEDSYLALMLAIFRMVELGAGGTHQDQWLEQLQESKLSLKMSSEGRALVIAANKRDLVALNGVTGGRSRTKQMSLDNHCKRQCSTRDDTNSRYSIGHRA